MDGGVANNTPISHAVELGASEVYVLPTGNACALTQAPSGALAMALHALSLLTQRRLIDDIERHREGTKLVVLPPPCPLSVQPIDFGHAPARRARAARRVRFLDGGGDEQPPIRMRTHRHAHAPSRASERPPRHKPCIRPRRTLRGGRVWGRRLPDAGLGLG